MDTSWATALYRARYSVSQKSAVIVKLLLSSYCIQFCFNFMSNLKLSYVTKQSFALLLINDRYFVYSMQLPPVLGWDKVVLFRQYAKHNMHA